LEPDAADLAAKLKHIQSHPDEAKARGSRAAVAVRNNYGWDGIVEKITDRLRHIASSAKTQSPAPKKIAQIELPPVARLGHLGPAREALGRKQYRAAWDLAAAALKVRPFHPEAWLILADSARGAGARTQADRCLAIGRKLAPNWKPFQSSARKKTRHAGKAPVNWPAVPELPDAPRLTVCLIVKNEEKFLGCCLQSVQGLAQQIVVVDTGSTDRTVDIAREFNAEVHAFPWNDDFSAARNEALKYAAGDWVLTVDADEELLPEHRETILQEMKADGVIGYRIPIINQGREDEGCGYVPRLFRNAPGLCFIGRIHEQVFSSLEARAQEWGLENRLGRSVLLHHGYSKEMVDCRGKKERNLRLLKLAVEELPGELNLMMNLGLELIRSGKLDAGLEKYREAFNKMSEMPADQVTPEFRESLLTQFTRHLLGAGRFNEIVELWRQPYPQASGLTASQHFMLGVARMELKQHAGAADEMRQCLTKRFQPALSPVNPEILHSGPHHCLAVSLAGLGQDAEAEKAFRDALAADPKSRAVRSDFAKFQFLHGRRLEALKLANELVAEDGRDLAMWLFGGEIALSDPEFLEFAQEWTGQAVKHFPEDSAVLLQHAEALMLAGHAAGALPLWTRASFPESARHLAALTLCELLQGACRRYFPAGAEKQVSQEFLRWYRRLIKFNAQSTVKQINERLEDLRSILPSAVGTLSAAMKKAEVAMAI
jgi:tetratricopeptide (TPR) repeat protein